MSDNNKSIVGKVRMTPKGAYDSSVEYEKLDIVTDSGNSYICLKANVGVSLDNIEYWQMIAKKGDNAKINGVTTIEIEEGTNIAITQVGNKLIISTTGVQAEITTENKLDSDLIDDTNKINKFVTAEEKNAWNGKVDKNVNDLSNYYNKDNSFSKDEVTQKIASELAKIIAEAPESFDTLKEIADWINTHAESASAMNSAINKNKADIEDLENDKADKTELADFVKNTDYASNTVGGTIKTDSIYSILIDENGKIYAETKSYERYKNASVKSFISKGTLDNILNVVVGDINSILDDINGEVV